MLRGLLLQASLTSPNPEEISTAWRELSTPAVSSCEILGFPNVRVYICVYVYIIYIERERERELSVADSPLSIPY